MFKISHLLSLGSMVQKGKFSAAAILVLVRTLKNVDFPTLGNPKYRQFNHIVAIREFYRGGRGCVLKNTPKIRKGGG